MPRPISLRVAPDFDLDTKTLLNIAKITQADVAQMKLSLLQRKDPNLADCYLERFSVLCEGAQHLLSTMPEPHALLTAENKAITTSYINDLLLAYEDALKAIEDKDKVALYQTELYDFSRRLVATLEVMLGVSEMTSMKMLSKSEEYVAILKKRPDLISVSTLTIDSETYTLLQREKPLPPFSRQIEADLWCIKQVTAETIMPDWYLAMSAFEKRMLRNALSKVKEGEALHEVFNNFISRLRTLPGVANFRSHEYYVIDKKGVCRTLGSCAASSMVSSRDMKNKGQKVRDFHTFENLKQILNENIEALIEKNLKNMADSLKDGDEVSVFIPYLVQTLISPRITSYLNNEPDFTLEKDKLRNMKNLQDYCREQVNKRLYKMTLTVETDTGKKQINVNVRPRVQALTINHPLNYAKFISYTDAKDEACQSLVAMVREYLKLNPRAPETSDIEDLLREYLEVLSVGGFTNATYNDANGRELFLSSLEQLLVRKMCGLGYGSCVSGKDRKAVELMHTDAMEIYRSFYKQWPRYNDTLRQRSLFVDIVCQLYMTGHHHKSAGLNGSFGIKTPSMYLPTDIWVLIQERFIRLNARRTDPLGIDDALASNNELHHIIQIKYKEVPVGMPLSRTGGDYKGLATDKLYEKGARFTGAIAEPRREPFPDDELPLNMRTCLLHIKDIVLHEKYWAKRTVTGPFAWLSSATSPVPKGIGKIREELHTGRLTSSSLPNIYLKVSQRSLKKHNRYDETTKLYDLINDLFFGSDNEHEVSRVLADLKVFRLKVCGPAVSGTREVPFHTTHTKF